MYFTSYRLEAEGDNKAAICKALKAKVAAMNEDERAQWYRDEQKKRKGEIATSRRSFSDPKAQIVQGASSGTETVARDGFRLVNEA